MKPETKIKLRKASIAAYWVSIAVYSMISIALLFTIILAPFAVLTMMMAGWSYKCIEKEKEAIAALQLEGVSE